jgi:hypothetical protein
VRRLGDPMLPPSGEASPCSPRSLGTTRCRRPRRQPVRSLVLDANNRFPIGFAASVSRWEKCSQLRTDAAAGITMPSPSSPRLASLFCRQPSRQAQPSRRRRMLLPAPAPGGAPTRLTISSTAPPSTRPSKLNDEEAYLPIQEAYHFFSSNRRRPCGSLFNLDIRSDKQLHARYVGPSLTFLLCKTEIPIPDLSYLAICTRFPIPTGKWQQAGHAVNGAAATCTRSILCTRHCLVSVSISVLC